MLEVIQSLATPMTIPPSNGSPPILSLLRREAYRDVLRDPSPPLPDINLVTEKVRELFPSHQLPEPLVVQQSQPTAHITFQQILDCTLRSKKNKSPSLSGWTRELFLPVLLHATPQLRAHLQTLFTSIANCSITPALLNFMTLTPCIQLATLEKKIRPICLRDYFLKVLFKVLLEKLTTQDAALSSAGTVFGLPGGAQLLAPLVQTAIDNGHDVIAIDCCNAFNEVRRSPGFEYLKKHSYTYHELFPLINAVYARQNDVLLYDHQKSLHARIPVTAGTQQGCVGHLVFHDLHCRWCSPPF